MRYEAAPFAKAIRGWGYIPKARVTATHTMTTAMVNLSMLVFLGTAFEVYAAIITFA